MILSQHKNYELLDCSGGEKLERFVDRVVIRPDPQVIWKTPRNHPLWSKADAAYTRSSTGGGKWEISNLPAFIDFEYNSLIMRLKPMNFKHMGIFPEQASNWDFAFDMIKKSERKIKVLNLFAYTGGATLACAKAGAEVCHVDAARGIVAMAKENAKLSGLETAPIRYIIDDCIKFVEREVRRGNKYDAIIMDPPSYGRGPSGEVWKLEDKLYDLLQCCTGILSDNPLFFILNSYTTGFSSGTIAYSLQSTVLKDRNGTVQADELGLEVKDSKLVLPCGSTARVSFL